MPIYAYQCAQCGHAFDKLQKMSDPDPETCPSCGAPQLKRQVTAPSFRLSGTGWYETDFKKDGDRKKNLGEGSSGGPKAETSKPDAPKADAPKSDSPKSDSPKADSAKPAASTPAAK